ncbi:MAG: hypothetical protein FJ125_06280 [Deltaproteobacteria bacterium]|nr:hypothetical protein [Deltaproteobacteria bacterium]
MNAYSLVFRCGLLALLVPALQLAAATPARGQEVTPGQAAEVPAADSAAMDADKPAAAGEAELLEQVDEPAVFVPPLPDPSIHRNAQPSLELGAKLVAKSLSRATPGAYAAPSATCADDDLELDDDDELSGCAMPSRGGTFHEGGTTDGYAGVGLVLRFRPSHFTALQLDLELLRNPDQQGDTGRQILALDTSLLVYFAHTERFELYGSFGFGTASVCWSVGDDEDCALGKGSAFGLHTGLGAQLVFGRHLRLFGELRGQMLAPLHESRTFDPAADERIYYQRDPMSHGRISHDVEPAGPFFVPSLSVGGTFGF